MQHRVRLTDRATTGPALGRPGLRCLLRLLPPERNQLPGPLRPRPARVRAQGEADPAGEGRVAEEDPATVGLRRYV